MKNKDNIFFVCLPLRPTSFLQTKNTSYSMYVVVIFHIHFIFGGFRFTIFNAKRDKKLDSSGKKVFIASGAFVIDSVPGSKGTK